MKLKRETPKLRAEELRTRRSSGTKRPRRFDAVAQGGIFGSLTAQRGAFPAERASAPSPSRPVTVRNTSFGMPIHRQVATANPRRAYYVPINATGAEMRLPSFPVIRPGWRLLSAAIAIAAGIGLFSVIFSPFFRVGQVAIEGQERLAITEIEAVLDLENLSIVEVDPAVVSEELLKRFPNLESASVSTALPTSVTVTLKERTPVLAWKQNDTLQWIDSQGVLFPPVGEVENLLVIHSPESPPMVLPESEQLLEEDAAGGADAEAAQESGPRLAKPVKASPARLEPALLQTAQKLAERLPAGTPLVFTAVQGLGWEDTTGYDVYIGSDLADFEARFAMVQSIAEQLTQRGLGIELISAANLDAPYYRLEQ